MTREFPLCCAHHGRTWNETDNGRLPPSEHAPSCKNYKPERFARLSWDGSICIVEWADREEFIAGKENDPEISEIWITRDQFDNLKEFEDP